jgi:DNA repair ATPase RecN
MSDDPASVQAFEWETTMAFANELAQPSEGMGAMANTQFRLAAELIVKLYNRCTMEAQHIMEIRQQVKDLRALLAEALAQRDEAKSKLGRIMEGLEGTCMTCEPVGVRNQQMEQHIKTLQAERDEARRMVCRCQFTMTELQHDYAKDKGWDCFKDETDNTSEDL